MSPRPVHQTAHAFGRRALLLGLSLAALAGCGRPAFTQGVRDRFGLSPADVRRLQFYNSGEIVLRREVTAQGRAERGNELVVRDGIVVEEVVIPMRTPGVALRVEGDYVLISFSKDRPDRALWFASRKEGEETLPLEDKKYTLVHLENQMNEPGPFAPRYAKGYQLSYGGHSYQIADKRMWDIYLLYDEGSFARLRVREEAPGWKLSDGPPPAPPPAPPPSAPAPASSP